MNVKHTDGQHDIVGRVYDFNAIASVTPPNHTFNADRVGFYTGMQFEEMSEKIRAIAKGAITPSQNDAFIELAELLKKWGNDFKEGKFLGAVLRSDREELLDGDIDISVVTIGALIYQTPFYRQAIAAVLDANDAKVPNGVATRDEKTGKIQKPDGWKKPELYYFVVQPNNG